MATIYSHCSKYWDILPWRWFAIICILLAPRSRLSITSIHPWISYTARRARRVTKSYRPCLLSNDTLNLSQGVETQGKQRPQIQNTGYLTLNHAVIISTCHANNSGPDPHYHSDVCTVILTTKTVASGAINLGRHMAGRRELGSGEKTGKPKS